MAHPKWSNKQKIIWRNVENYTSLIMKGDVKGFLEYFHEDYSGWNYKEALPVSKTDIEKELQHLPKRKILEYKTIPVAINVFNDVAIVHYYYSAVFTNVDGNEKSKIGHNTDILLKQKDKWVLIGDYSEMQNKVKE